MPGFTPDGLEISTLAEERELLNAGLRSEFGASLDVSDTAPEGQLAGIMAERTALLWEALEALVAARDPDRASGNALKTLCLITGTLSESATYSTVSLSLTGTPTTLIPTGTLVATASTGRQFATLAGTTLVAVLAWTPTTDYATAGVPAANSSRVYVVVTPGTSAGSGGPSGTGTAITDGTVVWRYVGEGTGYSTALAAATESGPIVAVSGDLTQKATPIGGWSSVVNLLDAELGRDAMLDSELRVLREIDLARPGTSPKDAVRAALRNIEGVSAVSVFQNVSDAVDADGMPPHSVEAVITGGDDQVIRNTLLQNVAAGIQTHGSVVGTARDEEGVLHTIKFSRLTERNVYVALTLTYEDGLWPADGEAQVKQAIATWGNAQANGRNVVASAISARAFSVSGVLSVTSVLISIAPVTTPVSSAEIAIGLRERAVYDTSRISIISSAVIP